METKYIYIIISIIIIGIGLGLGLYFGLKKDTLKQGNPQLSPSDQTDTNTKNENKLTRFTDDNYKLIKNDLLRGLIPKGIDRNNLTTVYDTNIKINCPQTDDINSQFRETCEWNNENEAKTECNKMIETSNDSFNRCIGFIEKENNNVKKYYGLSDPALLTFYVNDKSSSFKTITNPSIITKNYRVDKPQDGNYINKNNDTTQILIKNTSSIQNNKLNGVDCTLGTGVFSKTCKWFSFNSAKQNCDSLSTSNENHETCIGFIQINDDEFYGIAEPKITNLKINNNLSTVLRGF